MILVDTDHITVLRYVEHPRCSALKSRLQTVTGEAVATTVVTLEEQMRGWLTEISRWRQVQRQIVAYQSLTDLFDFFGRWQVVSLGAQAAENFERFRKSGVRIGTSDLKIASIAVARNALLLSAKLRDFRKVPGLRVENWLE
jgi:tRNA(fMet)-specific endonuclease VapC